MTITIKKIKNGNVIEETKINNIKYTGYHDFKDNQALLIWIDKNDKSGYIDLTETKNYNYDIDIYDNSME